MNRLFKSKPVGFAIVAACVAIIIVLASSLLFTTFTSFRTGIKGAVNTQTRELSTQIVYNYENYIGSIIAISNIIQTDVDRYNIDAAEGGAAFADYLRTVARLKNDIINISIYDGETGLCLTSSNPEEIGKPPGGDTQWFSEAIDDPTVHVFSVPYSDFGSEEYKVNVSKRIKYLNGDAYGVLKIEISFQSFIDLVGKSNLGEGGHITIIDPDYEIVYASAANPTPDEIAVVREIALGSYDTVINGYNTAINVDTLSNTKWRICVFINIDKLAEIENNFLATVIVVSCIVMIIGILLFMALARTITSPMKQLEQAMQKVEKSDYFRMEEVDIAASKEIETLILRFNRMMRKIGELMEHVITEQESRRRSELKALQNQINPHFLYNTLDSILWLIENNKNKEAGEMLVALSTLFRIGISNDSEVITVRDEIEHVRNYLLIQKIRYADSFDYEFDIDDGAEDYYTMKLVLQPIVENCIYHGLKNNIDEGHIRISAKISDGRLILRVGDNGYGMRREAIDELYRSFEDGAITNSVGLKNIYKRVMMYYGGNAGLSIESELDAGTVITLTEPLNQA